MAPYIVAARSAAGSASWPKRGA